MFLHRAIQWTSPPTFFSKLLQSPSSPPPNSQCSPQKHRRWTLPSIPMPSLSSLRSLLHYTKSNEDTKPSPPSKISIEHFQICINLVHHIFEICIIGLLTVFSPVFRVTLDVFGLQGAVKLWIHGLAVFLTTTYGMYLLLWLAHEYFFQLASFYGFLQALVLMVSLKAEREEKTRRGEEEPPGREEEVEGMTGKEDEREREGDGGEGEYMEDRWAGGSEDEMDNSDDMWVSDGEEEEVV